jgi:hypothetical protein
MLNTFSVCLDIRDRKHFWRERPLWRKRLSAIIVRSRKLRPHAELKRRQKANTERKAARDRKIKSRGGGIPWPHTPRDKRLSRLFAVFEYPDGV